MPTTYKERAANKSLGHVDDRVYGHGRDCPFGNSLKYLKQVDADISPPK